MSNTEKGAKIIEDAIEKNDDGSYSVTFKGLNKTYDIGQEELINTKEEDQYARGDDDVILLELAANEAIKDVKENFDNFKDNDSAALVYYLSDDPKDGKDYIGAGATLDVAAALFGLAPLANSGQINVSLTDNITKEAMEEIKNIDLKNCITEISFNTDLLEKTKDANGEDTTTTGRHAYSIKSIEGDNITVVNPWNTACEQEFKLDEILDKIMQVNYCHLK